VNTFNPKEFKVTALRECPTPDEMLNCETPEHAAEYWRLHIATSPHFNPECECFVILLLNTRHQVRLNGDRLAGFNVGFDPRRKVILQLHFPLSIVPCPPFYHEGRTER